MFAVSSLLHPYVRPLQRDPYFCPVSATYPPGRLLVETLDGWKLIFALKLLEINGEG